MSSDPRKWVRACTVHNQLVHKRIHLIFFLHRGRGVLRCSVYDARGTAVTEYAFTHYSTVYRYRLTTGWWDVGCALQRFRSFTGCILGFGTLRRRRTTRQPRAREARPLAPPRSRRRTAVRSSGGARRGVVGACRSLRPRCTAVRRTVVGTVNRLQLIYYSCTEIPMTVVGSLPHGTSHMYTV